MRFASNKSELNFCRVRSASEDVQRLGTSELGRQRVDLFDRREAGVLFRPELLGLGRRDLGYVNDIP